MLEITAKVDKRVKDYEMLSKGDFVVVGVSGGADSMFLLNYLIGKREELELNLSVANVEHGIRGQESVADSEFVKKYCEEHNVNFKSISIDAVNESKALGMGVEEYSRQRRYEFFNTFNELYNNKKQIILSSDQPPKELQSLNERIRSRFECGIPIDIHEPDYETRMAILKTKAEMDHLNDIPEEVFQYIAENVTNNIRELEGALHKIGIFSKLMKEEVTLETAKESLKDLINKEKNETITGETILKTVSEHMNISPDDIRSKKRSQDIATARQVVMYLCRKLTVMSLQSAGNIVGGRDHTTVINGINRVEAKRKEDPAFNNTIETIIKKLDTNA